LTQTPYVVLYCLPINRQPIENVVFRSVHHRQCRGVQLVHQFQGLCHLFSTGPPDHVSTLSGRAEPVSGQLCGTAGGGASHTCPGFPLPFGCRRWLHGHPLPAGELGLPHGRLTGHHRPDPDGVTAFRTHELRPGWEPPLPRGRRCSSRLSVLLNRRLPLHSGQSLHSATTSHRAGLFFTRHQRGFTRFSRPIFPSPVALGWNKGP